MTIIGKNNKEEIQQTAIQKITPLYCPITVNEFGNLQDQHSPSVDVIKRQKHHTCHTRD